MAWEFVASDEYGYSVLVDENYAEILTCGGINDGDSPIVWMGEELTNAHKALIEAAPDLLAACEAMVHAAKLNDPALGGVALTLAAAAVAKATEPVEA